MTKIACAVNGVDADYGKDEWAVPCVNHRQMVPDYVRRVKPQVPRPRTESYSWAVCRDSRVPRGRASARESPPPTRTPSTRCWWSARFGRHRRACRRRGGVPRLLPPGRISASVRHRHTAWWARTRYVAKKVTGATFFDTTHWDCVDGRCPIYTRTDLVRRSRRDYLHTSVQYARQLAQRTARRPHEGVGGAPCDCRARATSPPCHEGPDDGARLTASGARPSPAAGCLARHPGGPRAPVSRVGGRHRARGCGAAAARLSRPASPAGGASGRRRGLARGPTALDLERRAREADRGDEVEQEHLVEGVVVELLDRPEGDDAGRVYDARQGRVRLRQRARPRRAEPRSARHHRSPAAPQGNGSSLRGLVTRQLEAQRPGGQPMSPARPPGVGGVGHDVPS